MAKILIVEDEKPAARHLSSLIQQLRPAAKIQDVIDSVESCVKWLQNSPPPDLLFMDIQLADGVSFDIFRQVRVASPIIFTTAYDQYTLRAFKVNSIDYLLKPIDEEELRQSLEKYEQLRMPPDQNILQNLLSSLEVRSYKERFLIKTGNQLAYLPVSEIAYFYSEDGLVRAQNRQGKKHALDYTLDQLELALNPACFYRLNRKLIVHLEAIHKIHPYFNSRLKLELTPGADFEVIVSRDRVNGFKDWLDL